MVPCGVLPVNDASVRAPRAASEVVREVDRRHEHGAQRLFVLQQRDGILPWPSVQRVPSTAGASGADSTIQIGMQLRPAYRCTAVLVRDGVRALVGAGKGGQHPDGEAPVPDGGAGASTACVSRMRAMPRCTWRPAGRSGSSCANHIHR